MTLAVNDLQKSFDFYNKGLGFHSSKKPDASIAFFNTAGTTFAIYPKDKMKEEVPNPVFHDEGSFAGITLAHNVRTKPEVDIVFNQAIEAGATVEKSPSDTFWGGYSGYFSDLDGYLWEIAWGAFEIDDNGFLVLPT